MPQPIVGHAHHFDFDVKKIRPRHFRHDSARDDVHVLEFLQHAQKRSGVRVCDHKQPQERRGVCRVRVDDQAQS